MMTENEISEKIIGCAIQVHKELVYKAVKLDCGYRIDLLVENKVIVEIKSVEELDDIHLAQVLTYLKLSKCKLGLLINFNEKLVKDGIKRIVNRL